MWSFLGSSVDLLHAALMAAWALGIPLLFVRRWPRARAVYGAFAAVFIVVSQLSRLVLGECFFTTIARACWQRASPTALGASPEWFTVRMATLVFRMTPTHRSVVALSETLILVTAAAALASFARDARSASPRS